MYSSVTRAFMRVESSWWRRQLTLCIDAAIGQSLPPRDKDLRLLHLSVHLGHNYYHQVDGQRMSMLQHRL